MRMQNASRSLYVAALLLAWLPQSLSAAAPDTPQVLYQQAEQAASAGDHASAVRLLGQAIEQDPKFARAWYLRGREHFRLGKFKESCDDFDEYLRLEPAAASRQWERGISLYYAGRFADGARQFELYQTYHDNDVENSVWRYLCMARAESVDKAQAAMLPIADDRRPPMMQIYDLYRGKLTPEELLAAAEAPTADPARAKSQRFYAHLYLGLWHEAAGDARQAEKYLKLAAANDSPNPYINRYMWDVARVHVEQLASGSREAEKDRQSQRGAQSDE